MACTPRRTCDYCAEDKPREIAALQLLINVFRTNRTKPTRHS